MLSFITNIAAGIAASRSYKAQKQSYRTQAELARIQGNAQLNAANADAAAIEIAGRSRQEINARNLRTLRGNQTRVVESIRNKNGARGFTTDGTGSSNVQEAQLYFEEVIADAAMSASIDSINTWQTAVQTRRQGELASMVADLQGMQYDNAARQASIASRNILTGTLINGAVGAGMGIYAMGSAYTQAQAYNQNIEKLASRLTFDSAAEKTAWIDASRINPGLSAVIAGDSAASWGFNAMGTLNVWTAGMTRGQNWGNNMSILMGNTPGIPDNRYSLTNAD